VVRLGLERSYFDDLYHFLLIAPWSHEAPRDAPIRTWGDASPPPSENMPS
jgi:hypothetical protein